MHRDAIFSIIRTDIYNYEMTLASARMNPKFTKILREGVEPKIVALISLYSSFSNQYSGSHIDRLEELKKKLIQQCGEDAVSVKYTDNLIAYNLAALEANNARKLK